jgi:hypothetical protein
MAPRAGGVRRDSGGFGSCGEPESRGSVRERYGGGGGGGAQDADEEGDEEEAAPPPGE